MMKMMVGDDGDDVTVDGDHDKMMLVTIIIMEDGEQHS